MLSVLGLTFAAIAAGILSLALIDTWRRTRPAWLALGAELAAGTATNIVTVTIRNTSVASVASVPRMAEIAAPETVIYRPAFAKPQPAPFSGRFRGLRAAA